MRILGYLNHLLSSDVHDAVLPLLPLLVPFGSSKASGLPPHNPPPTSVQPPKSTPPVNPVSSSKQKTGSGSTSAQGPSSKSDSKPTTALQMDSGQSMGAQEQSSVYARSSHPHPTLLLALVSFLALLPVIMADILPLRLFSFLAGAGAVCALHPNVRSVLTSAWASRNTLSSFDLSFSVAIPMPTTPRLRLPAPFRRGANRRTSLSERRHLRFCISPKIARAVLRRVVDNDRLSDKAWPAPMCTVELWENERWESVGGTAPSEGRRSSFLGGSGRSRTEINGDSDKVEHGVSWPKAPPQGTWSKTHLRPSERASWTRGRDGWSGVGGEIRCVACLSYSLESAISICRRLVPSPRTWNVVN